MRLLAALLLTLAAAPALAQQSAAPAPLVPIDTPVTVGVAPAPPFAIPLEGGGWSGIGVDLFRLAAEEIGLSYRLERAEAGDLAAGVAQGRFELALPVPATPEAADAADLTTPFAMAPVGVATLRSDGLWRVVTNLVGVRFLSIVAALCALLLVVGAIVWGIERRSNGKQFHPSPVRGLGDGFWWAGVTLTTIGYGDKAPITFLGRAVAMAWMLVGLVVSAALTATLVALAGVDGATGRASLPQDVRGIVVGAVPGTPSAALLAGADIAFEPYPDAAAGLAALREGAVGAFVGPAPILRAAADDADGAAIAVDVTAARPLAFAFAAPRGSGLVEPLDRALLTRLPTTGWLDLVARYGPDG